MYYFLIFYVLPIIFLLCFYRYGIKKGVEFGLGESIFLFILMLIPFLNLFWALANLFAFATENFTDFYTKDNTNFLKKILRIKQ